MSVCYLKGRDSEMDRLYGCVCRLCERKRERHRVGVCLGYVKGMERGIE